MISGAVPRKLAMLSAGLAGILALAAPAGAAPPDSPGGPPGNNGTVKVDRQPFDSHPDNEPHVGCVFQIDFYGFDKGDYYADVIFSVQPPTGKGEEITKDRVFIGEDDNSGGGSEAGIDAQRSYDLTSPLAGFTPHPKQGYHVRLTVHADGSQGADTKHKVFWVNGCRGAQSAEASPPGSQESPPPGSAQSPPPGSAQSPPPGGSASAAGGPESAGQVKPGAESKVDTSEAARTEVKGQTVTRPQTAAPLAATGAATTLPLAGLGVGLLGSGQALRALARRRRTL